MKAEKYLKSVFWIDKKLNDALKFKNVISCGFHLANQGVTFRGSDKKPSLKRENFIELLKF